MLVLDAHCDAPSQMIRLRDFRVDNTRGQVDFPKMKRGGVDSSFFALYIPSSLHGDQATAYAFRLLDEVCRQLEAGKDIARLATSAEEVRSNSTEGLISVLLGIENASAIGQSFELLKQFKERGVRYITLTHSEDNLVCDSCSGKGSWGGLSSFGKSLVREMNRQGVMIDLAHASDKSVSDVLELSTSPVLFTHGCCRTLADHRRNLSDELIRGIGESGGVMGISIYPHFLDEGFNARFEASGLKTLLSLEDGFIANPSDRIASDRWYEAMEKFKTVSRPGVARVVDHIEHAVEIAGEDHVGIGTDYDGIEVTADGLEDISSLGLVFEEMRKRGFPERVVEKIAGLNFLRILG